MKEKKKVRCRFCNRFMKGKNCKCGASYKESNEYGHFLVWKKEIK